MGSLDMETRTDKLKIVGKHDERTIAQMRNCLRDDRATAGVLCADGHLGYVNGARPGDNLSRVVTELAFDISHRLRSPLS
jgi:hypothetical protein